ncbi:outer membrane protein [Methylopila jiangsuensis]|uniref:Outer membrane protein n=1 Tax=Methylopila jiangsuensis TaxID=586230 RepID=A0A9W6JKG6_9HYPH|nr:OmpW family protein [Methylopila jiangsuensis]MDR6286463.1 outer membrane protein [Methylopila jiangsuensis]GLK77198.1 outer membrane protein [Methylopila jiangsuensis]
MTALRAAALVLAASAALAPAAYAADAPIDEPAQAVSVPAEPFTGFMLRARAIAVLPNSSAKFNTPGSAHVSSRVMPEVDLSYFFTPNFAVETICCVSTHAIKGRGALRGVNVGDTWVLPATVMAQYHFTNFGAFKPYVGVGLNYSIFFGEDAAGGVVRKVKLKNSVGPAAQVGFDYMIDEHWGVNFDVKYIHMRPKIDIATAGGGSIRGKAKINPWVVGAGVTYRF